MHSRNILIFASSLFRVGSNGQLKPPTDVSRFG
jgi:hypothetical protein